MLRSSLFAVGVCVVAVLPAGAQDWAQKMFNSASHDFGQVARNAKTEYSFVLSNPYLEDVQILDARASCGCTSVRIQNPLLKTYEKGAIVATFNTRAYLGARGATITVTFGRPFPATAELHVKGTIRDDVTFDPEEVQLGTVQQGTPVQKRVRVTLAGANGWQLREVRSTNPHVSAQLTPAGFDGAYLSYDLLVGLDKAAPEGSVAEHLMLVGNDSQATQFPLLVEGRVMSGVTVSPPSLYLGVLPPGATVTRQIVVRGVRPFRVKSVSIDGRPVAVPPAGDGEQASAVHVIPVTFVARDAPGQAVEAVKIQTDLDDKVAEVSAYAVVSVPAQAQTQQGQQTLR
jgi:hypothetical protein